MAEPQPSKLRMGVRFSLSAPGAASLTGRAPGSYPGLWGIVALAAHQAGVTATGRPRELKPRGLCVRIAPSALRYPLAQPAAALGSGPRGSWFESREGSFAAAHGCGSAFVQRMARVGTGWRLACPRSPTAGGTSMRGWAVRVRIAPRTPEVADVLAHATRNTA
jgi:hypothetical protein